MNRIINNFFIIVIAVCIGGVLMFIFLKNNKLSTVKDTNQIELTKPIEETQTSSKPIINSGKLPNLQAAAQSSVKGVVHVKTRHLERLGYTNPFLDFLYGQGAGNPTREVLSSGSGVIISPDGYIVTNNHVIKNSNEIGVVLNDKRFFPAKIIGKDPSTDLALLKIEANQLDTIAFANSDSVALGEWVLAVGNPYNLTSTVTAGIVSAKARSITRHSDINNKLSIEAFIQTDAAVNPGNSGGALVNSEGKLLGINTAIQSRTGSYVGYSFAIPSNIVAKVAEDLREYGAVQRGYMGVSIVSISSLTAEIIEKYQVKEIKGVLIINTVNGGAADKAGLQARDIIIAINDKKTDNVEQLQEQLGKYRPNDKLKISIKRDGEIKHFNLVLQKDMYN